MPRLVRSRRGRTAEMAERADASTEQLVDRDWFSLVAPGAPRGWNSPRNPAQPHPSRHPCGNFAPLPKMTTTPLAPPQHRPQPRRISAGSLGTSHLTFKTHPMSKPSASPLAVHRARHTRCGLATRRRDGHGSGEGARRSMATFPRRTEDRRERTRRPVHRRVDGGRRRVPLQDVPDGRAVQRLRSVLPGG